MGILNTVRAVSETSHFLLFLRPMALVIGFLRRSENQGKIGKGESQVQKEADYRAIRARRDNDSRTQTEAGKETARVQKELEGRQRRGLEKSKKNRV
jgi:hypothetical protein